MEAEELFLPFALPKERVPLVSAVRSTVIISSLTGLRAAGRYDEYLAKLERRFHDVVASPNPNAWLPLDFALAHYDACQRLDLEPAMIDEIGAQSGRFVNETLLSVLTRVSKEFGVTPWFALSNSNTLGARTWMGGSFAVWKLGPKEARLEWIQQPVARFPYFRRAFGGFTKAICGHFARAMFVSELPMPNKATEIAYRLSWV
ncbi:MAG: hypothetical protein HYV09_11435 [Deltaproteobacteria bacterium]|nr:hypothetical protein [Deltaproteobacteria bacterium]